MLLPPEDAKLFFKLHSSLMFYVNQRLGVVPNIASSEELTDLPPETIIKIRDAFLDEVDLIESFVDDNPTNLSDDELDIILSWQDYVAGKFFVFRQLKKYMVLLSLDEPTIAYGVVAISQPLEELLGPYLPVMTKAVLLPFRDKIIYDGFLTSDNISFGGGIKRMLNDSYRMAKEQRSIITSLPIGSVPISSMKVKKKAATKRKPQKARSSGSKDTKSVLETILGITDEFCHEYLNDEYVALCRKLAEKLSRKRPSPLLRGRPKTWACGIIRTIGWVNFLDDSASQPHMKLTAIDKILGVAQSTGQGKSKEIRKMLKIHPFDMDWTLPSRMDDNLMGWMVEVDGFAMDVRRAPKEIQQIAFEKGLIPYIPADREAGKGKDGDKLKRISSPETYDQLYQFKITLNESRPAIWRRIQVTDCTLDKLNEYIQTAMGWTNSHLHQFQIDGKYYGNPEMLIDGLSDFQCVDSTVTMVSGIVPINGEPFRFLYEYDFGDGWEHEVLFEGCPQPEPSQQFPLCLEGQRSCPPEDVGGMWGYEEYLEALANPKHERHSELLQWSGPFDPDAFDAVAHTQLMRQGLPVWY